MRPFANTSGGCFSQERAKERERERRMETTGGIKFVGRVEGLDEGNGGLSFLFPAFLYFERKVPRVAPDGGMPVEDGE